MYCTVWGSVVSPIERTTSPDASRLSVCGHDLPSLGGGGKLNGVLVTALSLVRMVTSSAEAGSQNQNVPELYPAANAPIWLLCSVILASLGNSDRGSNCLTTLPVSLYSTTIGALEGSCPPAAVTVQTFKLSSRARASMSRVGSTANARRRLPLKSK